MISETLMRTTEVKVNPKRVVISYSHGTPRMQSGRLLILSRVDGALGLEQCLKTRARYQKKIGE